MAKGRDFMWTFSNKRQEGTNKNLLNKSSAGKNKGCAPHTTQVYSTNSWHSLLRIWELDELKQGPRESLFI